jgi:hypothetical protein
MDSMNENQQKQNQLERRAAYMRDYRKRNAVTDTVTDTAVTDDNDGTPISEERRRRRSAYMREFRANRRQNQADYPDDLQQNDVQRIETPTSQPSPARISTKAYSADSPDDTRRRLRNDAARIRYAHDSSAAREASKRQYDANRESAREASRSRYHANPGPSRDAARQASQCRRSVFREVKQEWDIDHPCRHCGYIWLKSSEAGLRKKCCQNGILWNETSPFILLPLPEELEQGFFNDEFVKGSNQFNNILSLGAIGIDNEQPNAGWDIIRGPHSVRLSGRTYHYIPASNTRGGIQYFLHDGRNIQLAAHGRERNVHVPTLERIFRFLQKENRLCRSYASIGSMAERLLMQQGPVAEVFTTERLNELCPQLSREVVEFDVSAITVDPSTGNRILRVALK